MPNWCNNNITISHPDRSKMEALVVAIKEGKFLNHIIPVPEELTGTTAPNRDPLSAEELKAKYGASDWYDFCTSRWGTKWDVDPYDPDAVVLDDNNTVSFGFDSAWAPPTGIYEAMTEQGYSVQAQYYEPGMGFVGSWEDGCDDYYDLSGLKSHEVRDTIGEFLDDGFGISETMAEYEAEEEDELQEWYEDGVEKKGLEPHQNDDKIRT